MTPCTESLFQHVDISDHNRRGFQFNPQLYQGHFQCHPKIFLFIIVPFSLLVHSRQVYCSGVSLCPSAMKDARMGSSLMSPPYSRSLWNLGDGEVDWLLLQPEKACD